MLPRHRTGVRRVAALAIAAAIIGIGACGGDDSSDTGGVDEFSVQRALAELPASTLRDDHYVVTVGDLDAASEAAGVERPAPHAGTDAVIDWSFPISGVAREGDPSPVTSLLLPEAANPDGLTRVDEFRDEMGWVITDVAWFAEVVASPMRFTVLHGDIDPAAIDGAIGQREDGVWSLGGEDFEIDLQARSAARPLGEALRLAEDEDAIAVSTSTPIIEEWLAGDDDRLDGDAGLVAVAEALDDHDVYAALLLDGSSQDVGPRIDPTEHGLEEPAGELLETFDTFGAGLTVVDGAAVAVLVYHHSTSAAAADNAERLEAIFDDAESVIDQRPIADTFVLRDVTVDGQTVTATVGFTEDGSPRMLWSAVWAREHFTTHA